MTIIAGFRCKNGVVLAADTEITNLGGTGKTYESKIFTINAQLGCSVAYTGDSDFAKELVDELRVATKNKTSEEALTAAKLIYREFWHEHYTKPPQDEKSHAFILLTLREGKKVTLYVGRTLNFPKIPEYAVLGVGQDLAEALFKPLYKSSATTTEAVYMAIYALWRVKGFAQWCGGDTEAVEVEDQDQPDTLDSPPLQDNREIEQDFDFFDEQIRPLLLAYPNLYIKPKTFRALLRRFEKNINQYRAKRFRENERDFKEWIKGVDKNR
ncbi:MAG TPA: hypothetical protein VNJ12_05405 [Candidatus Dormibacteraeota bacterium]|nr:hypothetical protein [Candidatus Dormibacteraeota bacterium]